MDLLDECVELGFNSEAALQLRMKYGGEEVYIRSPRPLIREQIIHADGSVRAIAKRFGVTRQSVSRIRR